MIDLIVSTDRELQKLFNNVVHFFMGITGISKRTIVRNAWVANLILYCVETYFRFAERIIPINAWVVITKSFGVIFFYQSVIASDRWEERALTEPQDQGDRDLAIVFKSIWISHIVITAMFYEYKLQIAQNFALFVVAYLQAMPREPPSKDKKKSLAMAEA